MGLDLKARKVPSARERQLMVRGKTDIHGKGVGGCHGELVDRVLINVDRFLDEPGQPVTEGSSAETKLRKQKNLRDKGLITTKEAAETRKEILRNI